MFEPVVGLEIHAQLRTASKAFSPDSAEFGADPNTHVDPVSLGHPGTLPVVNGRMVEAAILVGLATNCRIAARSEFARKHYFYPDLPKGYQISQFDAPLCEGGWLETSTGEGAETRRIGIARIHMEEDAGKSIHDQDPYFTLLDFNRSGVPLIEIVTRPDLRSPAEAGAFLRSIRQLVRYLGICDGNMEEGSLRCDANVSVRRAGDPAFGVKTEVKNLNSIRNVERAIAFEIERQVGRLESGLSIEQETRLWDADELVTRPLRGKEESHDYRYLPDPDLPAIDVSPDLLEAVRSAMPELPDARRARFVKDFHLPTYDAAVLTEERAVADYFEETLALVAHEKPSPDEAKAVSNFVMGDVARALNEHAIGIDDFPIEPARMAALIGMRLGERISSSAATRLFDEMLTNDADPERLAVELNLLQVSDTGALAPVVDAVIDANAGQVAAYRAGKTGLLGYFIGQVMRAFPGSPDPKLVRQLIVDKLGEGKVVVDDDDDDV